MNQRSARPASFVPALLGAALVVTGLVLPRDWYYALPRRPELPPPPFNGVILLQAALIAQGLAVIASGLVRTRFPPEGAAAVPGLAPRHVPEAAVSPSRATARWLVSAITLAAIALRLWRLDSDLWLDEITPILEYGDLQWYEVIATYAGSNNHMLNTLLGKLAIAAFGESAWAVRLPAAVFGALTVPALYRVSRLAASRLTSLCAALLLAVSYHHIFFSQNARGYAGHVLLSIVATAVLARAVRADRAKLWMLYAILMVANVATLLHGAFVLAAHALVVAVVAGIEMRRSGRMPPLAARAALVFGATGCAIATLYATALPQAWVFITNVYREPVGSPAPVAGSFITDVLSGLAAGVPPVLLALAVPAGAVGAIGVSALARRNPFLISALALPGVLTAATLLAGGLSFSPRFFILALPVTLLCGVEGVFVLAARVAGWRVLTARVQATVAVAAVLLGAIVSMAPLRRYYAVPKQPYREAIAYAESARPPGGIVVAVHLTEMGYRYYGIKAGLQEAQDFVLVRSVPALDRVLAAYPRDRVVLATTLERYLTTELPDLERRLARDWRVERTFPATIGGGDISVWTPRVTP